MKKPMTVVVLLLALAGCGTAPPAAAPTTPPAPTTSSAAALTVRDPWVKTAETGTTAAFGILVNSSGEELVVVSGSSTTATKTELHEIATVDGKMQMRPKEGGFVIPAGGTHELEPGGDHIMLLDITTPLKPGDQVTITLALDDGRTTTFTAVGKDFAGGNESYNPGMDMK